MFFVDTKRRSRYRIRWGSLSPCREVDLIANAGYLKKRQSCSDEGKDMVDWLMRENFSAGETLVSANVY
ncbi:MAG: hypothetical protein CL912_21000 [Deltaproteobacteria bacterium]|nr:hypothetical protein [Deltaproteobacteria bacterium]